MAKTEQKRIMTHAETHRHKSPSESPQLLELYCNTIRLVTALTDYNSSVIVDDPGRSKALIRTDQVGEARDLHKQSAFQLQLPLVSSYTVELARRHVHSFHHSTPDSTSGS
jgi:hypothetical protein